MVFALLVAAIIWNLSTWYFGLPASSSHTLIGSIIGVGIANQLMSARTGTSGVDWAQAMNIGKSLLLSPLVGFVGRVPAAFADEGRGQEPEALRSAGRHRAAAVLDSRSAAADLHRSELRPRIERWAKGMGLIMLILIGTVPTAYALNHAVTKAVAGLRRGVPTGRQHFEQVCQPERGHRRCARRSDGLRPHQGIHAEHHAGPAPVGQRHRQRNGAVRRAAPGAQRSGAQLPQRHVPGQRSAAPDAEDRISRTSRPATGQCWRITRSTSTMRPSSFRSG